MKLEGLVEKILGALLVSAILALFSMWKDVERLKMEQQQILDNYAEYIKDQMTKPCN